MKFKTEKPVKLHLHTTVHEDIMYFLEKYKFSRFRGRRMNVALEDLIRHGLIQLNLYQQYVEEFDEKKNGNKYRAASMYQELTNKITDIQAEMYEARLKINHLLVPFECPGCQDREKKKIGTDNFFYSVENNWYRCDSYDCRPTVGRYFPLRIWDMDDFRPDRPDESKWITDEDEIRKRYQGKLWTELQPAVHERYLAAISNHAALQLEKNAEIAEIKEELDRLSGDLT